MNLRSFGAHTPRLGARAWLDPTALAIGDVALGEDASVWPFAVLRGDVNRIRIGARTNIQDGSVLHVNQPTPDKPAGDPLTIGADVTVGHQVILHGCTIEDRCLVGMGSLVMDGARLCSGVLLAAGSLVSPGKELYGGWLWAGRPAKPVRELRPEEQEFFVRSAAHYVALKDVYRAG